MNGGYDGFLVKLTQQARMHLDWEHLSEPFTSHNAILWISIWT
jgi:hypothetical protein